MRLSACIKCWDEMERDNTAEYSRQKIENAAEFSRKMNKQATAQRKKYTPHIESISAELNINPLADASVHWWATGKADLNMPPPEIPVGYLYFPTPDHVGVLAAKELFDPSFSPEFATGDCLRAARLFRKRGFPASALWCLKQGAWELAGEDENYLRPAKRWRTSSENDKLLDELMRTYEALNRPLMVRSIKEMRANS